MLNIKSSLYNLLNPCKISSTNRHQTYISSEETTRQPGQEIRCSFPTNENFDMSQSFINMNVELKNVDPEVPWVVDFEPVPSAFPFADVGSFQLKYCGGITVPIPYDADATTIETALNNLREFAGQGLEVLVVDTGSVPPYVQSINTLQDSPGLSLVVSNFDWDTLPNLYGLEIVNSNLTLAGVRSGLSMITSQDPDYAYPRLEYSAGSIFSQIRVDFDGQTVINLNDVDILSGIVHQMHDNGSRYWDFETDVENFNGKYRPDAFTIRINLTDFLSLFRSIIPMKYIGKQLRIYLTLNQANKCLIQKTSTSNGSYNVSNFEFHYSRVDFHPQEEELIRTALKNNELIIPFIGYNQFSTNLTQGSTTQDVLFNPNSKGLLGILAVMRPESYITDPSNNRKTTTYLKNGLYSCRLKIGSNYFPLDILKSQNDDVTEYIEEYINTSILITGEEQINQRLFYNYSGNYIEDKVWIPSWDQAAPPTFVIGIETIAAPIDRHNRMCPSKALAGVDTSGLSNVILELRNFSLQETNTLEIFSIEQQYLVFGYNFFEWIK
jgi:hypothetical protein